MWHTGKGRVGNCVDTARGSPWCCPGELTWYCEPTADVRNQRAPPPFVLSPICITTGAWIFIVLNGL